MSKSGRLQDMQSAADESFRELHKIWQECGYSDDYCEQRRDAVVSRVKEVLCDAVKEERVAKNKIIERIEDVLEEIGLLAKELRCEIPTDDYRDLPLNEMEQALQNALERHCSVKRERQNKMLAMRGKEEEFCRRKGTKPVHLTVHTPTDEELETFRQYLKREQQELVQLQDIYNLKRTEIVKIAAELEYIPSLQFEVCVFSDDGSFVYSEANMNELENLRCRLENDLKESKTLISEMSTKLTVLWDRLQQDTDYRRQFLSGCRGYGMKTVDRIKNELIRLEEMKRKNIRKFVDAIREELQEWWQRCYYSDNQKQLFLPFRSACYTDKLLELHEMEVQKMKQFYEANLDIFRLLKQREDLWNRMLDIENVSYDKKRLCNRGGLLLQEERERRKIKKDLPKIEAVLLKYVASYEKENKTPFLVNGEALSEVIEKQQKDHQGSKVQEFQARKRGQGNSAGSMCRDRSISKDSNRKHKRLKPDNQKPQKHARIVIGNTLSANKRSSLARKRRSRSNIAGRTAARKDLRPSGDGQVSRNDDTAQAEDVNVPSTSHAHTHFKAPDD